MAQFPKLIKALLDPKTYPHSPSPGRLTSTIIQRFEAVDLDDLKSLYPNLDIVHLAVDTSQDSPEDWYIIGVEKG